MTIVRTCDTCLRVIDPSETSVNVDITGRGLNANDLVHLKCWAATAEVDDADFDTVMTEMIGQDWRAMRTIAEPEERTPEEDAAYILETLTSAARAAVSSSPEWARPLPMVQLGTMLTMARHLLDTTDAGVRTSRLPFDDRLESDIDSLL